VTSLADRLREIIRTDEIRRVPPPDAPDNRAAAVLEGEWYERGGERFLLVERRYGPGYRHGRVALADCLPPASGAWSTLNLLGGGTSQHGTSDKPRRLLFLDLETTGLAGGAGTYAFLVGCGWFDGTGFRTRQFFLSTFGAERGLLESVADLAAAAACVVTYNGRTFDVPVLETRFALHRLPTPFDGLPHVDMLHPARRLWREGDAECRLMSLERALCGHEREGDVPGFEIPSRYFQYVRRGDARPLAAVLEHNRLDLMALAVFTARAAQLLDEGPESAATSQEALGMGRLYERAGLTGEALESFARAARIGHDGAVPRAEALRAHAVLCRRLRRFDEAATSWRQALDARGCPPTIAREATEALAIHHEHRARDLAAARSFALHALRMQPTAERQRAVQHRLDRLDRKIESRTAGPPPALVLFPAGS